MLKKYLKLMLIVPVLLVSNHAFSDELSPNEAINACLNNSSILFEEDGHFYTTYAIAKLAGQSDNNAFPLSYFSQYPDESPYTATKNSIISLFKLQPIVNKNGFEKQVVEKLHSLYGGKNKTIENRRKSLNTAIKFNLKNKDDYWKAGLLIHAYGDAFAHTTGDYNKDNEASYSYPIGHAFDSAFKTNPDKIVTAKEKYIAYTKQLYSLLETSNADKKAFSNFISKINDKNCTTNECIQTIIKNAANGGISSKKAQQLNNDILSKGPHLNRLERFSSCMSNHMRSLTQNEIQDVMDQIK